MTTKSEQDMVKDIGKNIVVILLGVVIFLGYLLISGLIILNFIYLLKSLFTYIQRYGILLGILTTLGIITGEIFGIVILVFIVRKIREQIQYSPVLRTLFRVKK